MNPHQVAAVVVVMGLATKSLKRNLVGEYNVTVGYTPLNCICRLRITVFQYLTVHHNAAVLPEYAAIAEGLSSSLMWRYFG